MEVSMKRPSNALYMRGNHEHRTMAAHFPHDANEFDRGHPVNLQVLEG
jgi:hypothetical protein